MDKIWEETLARIDILEGQMAILDPMIHALFKELNANKEPKAVQKPEADQKPDQKL